jgi:hypothetical protein
MRLVFIILFFFLTEVSFSQSYRYMDTIYKSKGTGDDTLELCLRLLNGFHKKNGQDFDTEFLSEKIACIYKERGEYAKAVAYFDSADLKYNSRSGCMWGFWLRSIPRVKQKAYCWNEMCLTDSAIALLTPYLFNREQWGVQGFFNTSDVAVYKKYVFSRYSKKEVNEIIDKAFNSMRFSYTMSERSEFMNRVFEPRPLIRFSMKLFGVKIEEFDETIQLADKNEKPTKEHLINEIKNTKGYKALMEGE